MGHIREHTTLTIQPLHGQHEFYLEYRSKVPVIINWNFGQTKGIVFARSTHAVNTLLTQIVPSVIAGRDFG